MIKALNAEVEELPIEDSPKQDPALARFTLPQARLDIRAAALALLAESFMKRGTGEMNGSDRDQIVVDVFRGISVGHRGNVARWLRAAAISSTARAFPRKRAVAWRAIRALTWSREPERRLYSERTIARSLRCLFF